MESGNKPVHEFRHVLEMWRLVIANINWLFSESAAELREIRHGNMIQCPKHIFIKTCMSLNKTNLDAVR